VSFTPRTLQPTEEAQLVAFLTEEDILRHLESVTMGCPSCPRVTPRVGLLQPKGTLEVNVASGDAVGDSQRLLRDLARKLQLLHGPEQRGHADER
jgi:hypothetical protein